MAYFFYGHGGSGDHGSEDRIRGTCRLLPCRPEVLSLRPGEDWQFGLGRLADLSRLCCAGIGPGDVCLAFHPDAGLRLRGFGASVILWCWTPGKLTPQQTKRLDTVVVTDLRSVQMLQKRGIRVVLGPDPAFLVDRTLRPMDGAFRRDTVGLCCGAIAGNYEERSGLLYESYCHLIRWLLSQTQMDIALIPYCSSDGPLLQTLHRQFADNGRLFLRPDGPSPELRGDLSLCRFVIGSAGAIAAWSCGVPALCLGADPRAMTLATELFGTWHHTVQPVAWLKDPEDLTRAFRVLMGKEDALRRQLETAVPYRRQRSLSWSWNTMSMQA